MWKSWFHLGKTENLALVVSVQERVLTNSAPPRSSSRALSWPTPNIYLIHDELEWVKGLVLQNQSCRISMTQGNSSVVRVQQKEKALN